MNKAPIALFVYNRPEHTKKTLEYLKNNYGALDSDLYIFSDGPRTMRDVDRVSEVRDIVNNIDGFNRITVNEKNDNCGLANSIICGVTELCDNYGKVIVVEDDLLTSPYFLTYMNDALEKYEKIDRVMHISGYMFPVDNAMSLPDAFFLRMTSSWGWATWKRAWDNFEPSAEHLLKKIDSADLKSEFDIMSTFNYKKMLKKQCNGAIDSWAVRWYASVFLKNSLGLFPSHSYVKNIGFDDSGVHCGKVNHYDVGLSKKSKIRMPIDLVASDKANILLQKYYLKTREPMYKKIIRKLWKMV
ncbi:MAG: hypothetical protein L3K25_06305 [Gammaproteobacteria bacterium]|nr:hypothetical protein [Gammaproteobacteria bacterium]MCF6337247.1 hypothetical protein [Gammaproteobacteria bacterium]